MRPIIDLLHRDRTSRPSVNNALVVLDWDEETLVYEHIPIFDKQLANLRAHANQEMRQAQFLVELWSMLLLDEGALECGIHLIQ